MQLTIHDAHLKKVAFIDNEKPKTLNFYDDTWTRNLQTGSSTYEFSISKKQLVSDTVLERTYNYLNERSFVSFEYKGKTYLFNVMTVEEDEKKIKCYCENLNLELINEYSNAYEADRAMTFVEYCNAMDLLSMPKLSIGINEISDYKRTLKWEGQDTKLARLISLANKFDAEIDFETFLNADSTIKSFLVNVYHENDGNYHGVGRVRKDITLVYGKNLKSIKRKIDKTGIFNMTVPSSSDTVEDEPINTGESSAKTVVTKNADGSVTKTTTKKASDGTTVQTKVTTKVVDNADGSRVTTVRTEKSNGLITEKVTTRNANGNTDTQTKTIREATSETAETVEEHITLSGLPDWEIKNDSGVVEFYKRGDALYAPISAQLYPSTFTSDTQGDQWIRRDLTFDVETDTQLQTEALKQLKAAAYPELTYEFDGYIDADIGDTVQISDSGFTNMLLLEARIFGQKLSFSSEKNWKTTLGNFKALQNMLSSDIQAELEKLVDDAKPYTIRISSDNGITFKNGEGESLIKATLWKGNKVLDADVTWRWALDGNVSVAMQYLAKASTIKDTAVLTVSAYVGNNEVATTEITLTNVNDGADGAKGETGNGIANTVTTYGLSTSETTEPATWASNMPVLVKGMYLWTRTVQIYTNGTSSTSYQKGYIPKDGAQGLPGTPGKDAQTQYTHIAYADNATGGGFSLTDNTKPYWGMYQDFNAANSNDPTKYKWSKWKGDQGLPGAPGADGKTPYIHFAYADDNKGTNLSFTDKNQQYQGYYSDYTEANSTDYKKYTWVDRLANVQVGGRNLFLNSLFKRDLHAEYSTYKLIDDTNSTQGQLVATIDTTTKYLNSNSLKIVSTYDGTSKNQKITFQTGGDSRTGAANEMSNKSVMMSFYAKSTVANTVFRARAGYRSQTQNLSIGTEWKYYSFQLIKPLATDATNEVIMHVDTKATIWIVRPKVEIGTVSTDHTEAPEDTQEQIDSKADSALTQEQLNALAEQDNLIKAEMEAKASIDTVDKWITAYENYVKANDADKAKSEQALKEASERIVQMKYEVNDLKLVWEAIDRFMSFQNEGLVIGKKDGSAYAKFSDDRISLFSGSSEVMYISQGTLNIANGIFTKTIQIGRFRFETHPADADMLVLRYLGG